MHVHVITHLLVPGVKDLNDTGESAEVPGISGQLKEYPGTAPVEHAVKKLLVGIQKTVQLVRKSEHDMKIRRVYDFGTAGIDPALLFDRLTVGTVAVTAGVVVKFPVTAVRTDAQVHTKAAGAAGKDSP